MSTLIRPATSSDGPAVYALWDQIRHNDADLDDRIVTMPIEERAFLADWSVQLARNTSHTFVASEDDALTGFVTVAIEAGAPGRLPERHATIGYLYVDPGHRGSGLGRKLFDAARAWAADQEGIEHLEMSVLAGNKAAEGFWRSLGFSPFIERLWAPLNPR